MFDLAKILFAQAEKCSAIKFRVAAHIIICVRVQLAAVGITPKLFCIVASTSIHFQRVPILFFAWNEWTPLDQENLLTARSQTVSQSPAARSRTDDNEIVIAIIHTPIRRHESRILTRTFCVRSPKGAESTSFRPLR